MDRSEEKTFVCHLNFNLVALFEAYRLTNVIGYGYLMRPQGRSSSKRLAKAPISFPVGVASSMMF